MTIDWKGSSIWPSDCFRRRMLGRDAQQVHPGAGALALPFRLGVEILQGGPPQL